MDNKFCSFHFWIMNWFSKVILGKHQNCWWYNPLSTMLEWLIMVLWPKSEGVHKWMRIISPLYNKFFVERRSRTSINFINENSSLLIGSVRFGAWIMGLFKKWFRKWILRRSSTNANLIMNVTPFLRLWNLIRTERPDIIHSWVGWAPSVLDLPASFKYPAGR